MQLYMAGPGLLSRHLNDLNYYVKCLHVATACCCANCPAGPESRSGAVSWLSKAALMRLSAIVLIFTTLFLTAATARSQAVTVRTASELQYAVAAANSSGGNVSILLADGTYTLADTVYVNAPKVTIAGQSGDRSKVIIQGDAMSASAKVQNLIRAAGKNFTIRDLTLRKSGWHLLQIVGESDADGALVSNVVFQDAYEQMLKVSIDQANYAMTADNGVIENSVFEYTAGIGPQYYIGGIDVHGGKNWIVRGNTFRSIISPSQTVAEFAIHFWNQSANALVERNLIINCDRGVGFGLDNRGNTGGIIRNNMIYASASAAGPFADASIYLDQSPGTQVLNNTIYVEHSYPRAIEYRFAETSGVLIANNLTNKAIGARDGATGTVYTNVTNAQLGWFRNARQGDLHLASAVPGVVDSGRTVSGLDYDFDGDSRPIGAGIDIGADEYGAAVAAPKPPTNLTISD